MNPVEITKINPTSIRIRWEDSSESNYTTLYLRLNCTCAGCMDEVTGRRTLKAESVPTDVGVVDAKLVGNYGIQLFFTDLHSTGIYTWKYLYEIAPR